MELRDNNTFTDAQETTSFVSQQDQKPGRSYCARMEVVTWPKTRGRPISMRQDHSERTTENQAWKFYIQLLAST